MEHVHHSTEQALYKSESLNKFANTNPLYVVGIFFALTVAIFGYSCTLATTSLIVKIALLIAGILTFTFAEYVFHRSLYHSGDDFKNEDNWQYKIHGVHHIHPNVKHILAMPIPLALLVSSAFFGLFYLAMGSLSFHFFPGFILGYAIYIFIHVMIHTRKPPKNVFAYLWKHHHMHHYHFEDKAYGVSSHLWDFVFGTMPPKDAKGKVG